MKMSKSVSGWLVALVLAWIALGVRMVVAGVRHESLAGDLALPAFAFFACTALVVSQAYSRLLRPSI